MYCQSGNICEVLIFTNFVKTIFQIQQSHKEVIQMISVKLLMIYIYIYIYIDDILITFLHKYLSLED